MLEFNADGDVRWIDTKKHFRVEITNRDEARVRYYPDRSGKPLIVSVYKIIATLFIPNPHEYKYVKRIDGDPLNWSANNLRWSKSSRG